MEINMNDYKPLALKLHELFSQHFKTEEYQGNMGDILQNFANFVINMASPEDSVAILKHVARVFDWLAENATIVPIKPKH